jgi:hypothetical protein
LNVDLRIIDICRVILNSEVIVAYSEKDAFELLVKGAGVRDCSSALVML